MGVTSFRQQGLCRPGAFSVHQIERERLLVAVHDHCQPFADGIPQPRGHVLAQAGAVPVGHEQHPDLGSPEPLHAEVASVPVFHDGPAYADAVLPFLRRQDDAVCDHGIEQHVRP